MLKTISRTVFNVMESLISLYLLAYKYVSVIKYNYISSLRRGIRLQSPEVRFIPVISSFLYFVRYIVSFICAIYL